MRSRAKYAWPLAIVGAMVVARCGGALAPAPTVLEDAAPPTDDDGDHPWLDLDADVIPDTSIVRLPGPDGGFDPPTVACSLVDAGDAAACPMPASVCANADWLVYYDKGKCVNGLCAWTKHFRDCDCYKGSCISVTTEPPN